MSSKDDEARYQILDYRYMNIYTSRYVERRNLKNKFQAYLPIFFTPLRENYLELACYLLEEEKNALFELTDKEREGEREVDFMLDILRFRSFLVLVNEEEAVSFYDLLEEEFNSMDEEEYRSYQKTIEAIKKSFVLLRRDKKEQEKRKQKVKSDVKKWYNCLE